MFIHYIGVRSGIRIIILNISVESGSLTRFFFLCNLRHNREGCEVEIKPESSDSPEKTVDEALKTLSRVTRKN